MGYSFDEKTKSESINKNFESGIHTGVELESVLFISPYNDGSGSPVLTFNFKGANGETYKHLEWEVGDQATDIAKSQEALAKRVKHILTKFIPEEDCKLSGSNYAEFSNGVIALLGSNNVGKKVAIKLVYNAKGNVGFTKYVGFIANDAKDLRIGNSELMTIPSATPSTQADLGLEDLPKDTEPSNELPF